MTERARRAVPSMRQAEADRSGIWVVGIDGSPFSEAAATWAVDHAGGRTSRLRLVTAWRAALSGPYVGTEIESQQADEIVDTSIAAVRRRVLESGLEDSLAVDARVIHGGASAVLLDASERASLLILGHRGRGALAQLVLGSTSNQCITHAVVPTVVVPAYHHTSRQDTSDDHVLVGFDGSRNSIDAFTWAVDFAPSDGTVEALTVGDPIELPSRTVEALVAVAAANSGDDVEPLVRAAAAAAVRRNVVLQHRFVAGNPSDQLSTAAQSADLLAVGKRGRGAIGAALMGSVSTSLLRRTSAPIVVVPENCLQREPETSTILGTPIAPSGT